MIRYCMDNISNTNGKTHKKLLGKLYIMLFTVLIIIGITSVQVEAASGLKIYNYTTNKTTSYTDKRVKVTCNGTTIGSTATPGILIKGVSMQPYDDIFNSSRIAADCSYDSKKNTITISKYGKKIVMKVGSTKATVNGKSVSLSVAPMKVKYVTANKTKILVPSKFVASTFGLGYTWNSSKSTVAIVKKTIMISINSGAKYEYSGPQVKVTIDGKSVNLAAQPNIILNNNVLLLAKTVFADSTIKASYNYDSKSKKITLKKNNTVITMTIGSKTAYVNNAKKSLPTAPVLLTNKETGNSYVLVPGTFTTTTLGYKYNWNNSTRTSVIVKNSPPKTPTKEPELGDDGDVTDTGIILKEWIAATKNYAIPTGVHSLSSTIKKVGKLTSISQSTANTKPNTETFVLVSSTGFGAISSSSSGKTITLQASYTSASNPTNHFTTANSKLVSSIKTTNKSSSSSVAIELNLRQNYYQYALSFSSDKKSLMVTVYTNTLKSVLIGTNSEAEYMVIESVDNMHASVSTSGTKITIDSPDCLNGIGSLSSDIKNTKYISKVSSTTSSGKTQIILTMKAGYTYRVEQNGKKFKLILQESHISVVVDKSKYEIVIPLSSELNMSTITDEDFYYKNYFVIRMKGDYRSFYQKKAISETSKTVSGRSVSLNSSGYTEIKFTTTKIQGYELATDSKNLYIRVGNPNEIYKNIVVLDPGHGGAAVGAKNQGYYEKDINFKILYTIGKKYFNQDPSKLKVYYTRTADYDISLEDRAAFASKVGADLFVSLHMNSALNAASAKGTEVFYSSDNNSPNKAGLTSKMMATNFVNNICKALGSTNRGVKQDALYVTKRNSVPAVLIELGFISNSSDLAMITNSAKQDTAAKTIYNTLLDLFKKYPG